MSHGDTCADALEQVRMVGIVLLIDAGDAHAGSNGIDLDLVGAPLHGKDLSELIDAGLAYGIDGGAVIQALEGRDGAEIDDFAAVVFHEREGGAAAPVGTAQIDVHDGVPIIILIVEDGLHSVDSGIVDQDIEAAELFLHIIEQTFDGLLAGNVYGMCVDVEASGAHFFGGGVAFLHITVGANDGSASFRQTFSHGSAETNAGSGDDGNLSGEIKKLVHFLLLGMLEYFVAADISRPAVC